MPYKLTVKQRRAAILIAEGELDLEIQTRLKIRNGTLERWRRIPQFMDVITRHVQNIQDTIPYRTNMLRNLSVSAACAELSYMPVAKNIQQIHRIIKQTGKLYDLELGALELGDPEVTDITHAAINATTPGLSQQLNKISENNPHWLKAAQTPPNVPGSPEMPQENPQDTEIQRIIQYCSTLSEQKEPPDNP